MADVAAPVGQASRSWHRDAGLMSLVTVVVAAGNYLLSLLALHRLSAENFSRFASGQALLLIAGNGAMAAIPWAVARFIALAEQSDPATARAQGLSFGLRASVWQAFAAAAVAIAVLFTVAGASVATVTAFGAAALSLVAAPVGYLQSTYRVARLARLRACEGVVRVGSGIVMLALLSRDPGLALIGFPLGAMLLLALSLQSCREAFPLQRPDRRTSRQLLHQSLGLGAVQVLLISLGTADAIAAQASHFGSAVGKYQSAALIGRIPLFVSVAVGIAVYVDLVTAADDREVAAHVGGVLRIYALVVVPVLIACWMVPRQVLAVFVPHADGTVLTLLRYTSTSAAAIGLVNILTTIHQARGRIRPAIAVLLPAAVLQPVLLVTMGRTQGMTAFAITLVAISLTVTVLITVDCRRWLRLPGRRVLS